MPPPEHVTLGPLTRTVLDGAVWREQSLFPVSQVWADEVERVLAFLSAQGVFETFLPRLRARESERDGALAEARVGFFFHRNGFRILQWEPAEVPDHPADIEIQWRDTDSIFVEVKGPGWEGELSPREHQDRRQHLPKYNEHKSEARSTDPIERVFYGVSKALPKLPIHRINLVVIVDDLFFSPLDLPQSYVADALAYGIRDPIYETVGGVFLLNPVACGDSVEYRKYFLANPAAAQPLPQAVFEGLAAGSSDP